MPEARVRKGEARLCEASDATLVKRLRAHDIPTFEQLYRSHYARMWQFLHNLLRRPHLVEEVLDDTMMVVWNKIDGFDGRSRLSTWMFGIAYRQGLAALRKLDEPVEDDEGAVQERPEADPECVAGQLRSRDLLAQRIATLSPSHRTVVNLTYVEQFSYREIADIMDCPVDTVKTRMFHARRQLRRKLPGEFADWI